MDNNLKRSRQINLDMLKIVSMFMVVLMHALGHGHVLESCKIYTIDYAVYWGLRAASYPCVNCFVFISGYFLVDYKIKISKIFKLWVQVLFFSVIGYCIEVIFTHSISIKELLCVLSPISSEEYWFITCYTLLYMFSPLLNKVQNSITKRQHFITIAVFLAIFSVIPTFLYWTKDTLSGGRDLPWFITLYFIAGYIKKYGWQIRFKLCAIIYVLGTFLTLGTNIVITMIRNSSSAADIFYYNNSPFIVVTSLAFFGMFLNIKPQSKLLHWFSNVSLYTLGIYLLHENRFLREKIWGLFDFTSRINTGLYSMFVNILIIITAVFSICIVGILADLIRDFLYRHCVPSIIEKKMNVLEKRLLCPNNVRKHDEEYKK